MKKENEDWKIINLTNLKEDYNKDIVQIIEETMKSRSLESRKKAVEFIIRDYKRKMDNFQAERQKLKEEIEKLEKEKFEQSEILIKHKAVSKSLKELHNNLSLV